MPDAERGLVMPFIATKSNGGSLDDEAYACGWECGSLCVMIAQAAEFGGVTLSRYVHTVNVPQLDLLAMQNGMKVVASEVWEDDDTYTWVTISNVLGPDGEEGDDDEGR